MGSLEGFGKGKHPLARRLALQTRVHDATTAMIRLAMPRRLRIRHWISDRLGRLATRLDAPVCNWRDVEGRRLRDKFRPHAEAFVRGIEDWSDVSPEPPEADTLKGSPVPTEGGRDG